MPAERAPEHTAPLAAARRRRCAPTGRPLADLRRHLVSRPAALPAAPRPHEDVLAAGRQTSRHTVRHALDLLHAEQLVEWLTGVGTVVVAEKCSHGLDRPMGPAQTLREHGRVAGEVRAMEPVAAPAPVAEPPRLPTGTDVR